MSQAPHSENPMANDPIDWNAFDEFVNFDSELHLPVADYDMQGNETQEDG